MQKPGHCSFWSGRTVKEFCIIGHGEQTGTQTTRFAKYQGKEAFASREKHNDKFRFFEEWGGNVVCRVEQFGHVCLPLAEAAFKYRQEVEDFIEVPKIIEDRIVDAFSKLTKDQEKGTAEIQRFLKKVCKWIILCCLDYLGLLSLVLHSQSFNWILTLVDTEFQPHTVHKTVTVQKKYPTFKLPTRAIASETRTLCFFQNLFTRNWQWNQVEF